MEWFAWFERNGLATIEVFAVGWFFATRIWPWLKDYLTAKLKFEQEHRNAEIERSAQLSAVVQASTDANRQVASAMENLSRDVRAEMTQVQQGLAVLLERLPDRGGL